MQGTGYSSKILRIICLALVFAIFACSSQDSGSDDVDSVQVLNILGTWQMNGQKLSAGGSLPEDFQEVTDGPKLSFAFDLKYRWITVENELISSGKFSLSDAVLTLEPTAGTIEEVSTYAIDLQDDEMILVPTGPVVCIEGCVYRYGKIN